ncbi:4Fe-4S dicluster domain-containing protein [candidate division GN15 bacterium]|nr:4Fe-4S dicluster domain-containing protein [candidate division GN15 bacterium]
MFVKVIAVHVDRCTGCKTCELYCAVERGSNSKNLLQAAGELPAPQARLRVEGSNQASLPFQCRHCLKAPCLDVCLAGALERDETSGLVVIDESLCIGCWTCTMFCPYGAIAPWPERKIALKCDRCLYMDYPVCVEVCPTQALELFDIQAYESFLRRKRHPVAAAVNELDQSDSLLVLDLAPSE